MSTTKNPLHELPTSELPEKYHQRVFAAIDQARTMMRENNGELMPVLFLGNDRELEIIGTHFTTPESKDNFAQFAKNRAQEMKADFALFMSESWSLPPEKAADYKAITQQYGSIGASPYRIDVMMISVETPDGIYMAMPKIISRNFGEPRFTKMNGAAGRFGEFLKKED